MALKPDTTTDDENVAAEEKQSFREGVLEDIAARRTETLQAESEAEGAAEVDDDGGEAELAAAEAKAGDEIDDGDEPTGDEDAAEEAAGESGAEAEPAAAASADEQMVEVIVDGRKEILPLSKITASYQIESAARQRLNEATELLNVARNAQAQAAAAPAEEDPPVPVVDQVDWQDLAYTLQHGDEEESAEKLKSVVQQLRQADGEGGEALDVGALENRVRSQVQSKVEWDTAIKDIGRENPDILSDPKLAALSGAHANRVLQQELYREQTEGVARRPFYDILQEGIEDTRKWATQVGFPLTTEGDSTEGSPDPEKDADPTVALSDERQEAKVSATGKQPRPRVVRRRRADTRETSGPPSEVDRARGAIADIQKARGQA